MGMFDSLYDANGNEWQTKAFSCNLVDYRIGDRLSDAGDYQVEVLGGPRPGSVDSFATVRAGVLAEVPADRDHSLLLLDYYGGPVPAKEA